jgi:hypothetical protein
VPALVDQGTACPGRRPLSAGRLSAFSRNGVRIGPERCPLWAGTSVRFQPDYADYRSFVRTLCVCFPQVRLIPGRFRDRRFGVNRSRGAGARDGSLCAGIPELLAGSPPVRAGDADLGWCHRSVGDDWVDFRRRSPVSTGRASRADSPRGAGTTSRGPDEHWFGPALHDRQPRPQFRKKPGAGGRMISGDVSHPRPPQP